MINLTSDTVTKPSEEMLRAMMSAEVGDDVFRTDPTVNALEEKAAQLFGMEAALFCPSGTMTNQIAMNVHTGRLEEVICHEYSHVYQYETGGYAANSGIPLNLLQGDFGKLNADQIAVAIRPDYDWLPKSKLVVLENTTNKGGGSYYSLDEIRPIRKLCSEHGLGLHMDGARFFNALVELGDDPTDWGEEFDSISICLSKGLGAPVGSLLLGSEKMMKQARRQRKVMGGGMRQVGFLAAAGIYALDNNVERLKEDHEHARMISRVLEKLEYVENIRRVQTNILIFDVKNPWTANSFLEKIRERGIAAAPFGPQTVRFVTHLDVTKKMIKEVIDILESI